MLTTIDHAATQTATPRDPLTMPDIPTMETEYDRFKARRASLTEALRARPEAQIAGSLRDASGGVCFVGLGIDLLGAGET